MRRGGPCATAEDGVTKCHLCDTDLGSAIVVNTIARHGEPQMSVACSRCGLVQVDTLPSEAELAEYYRDEYRVKFPWSPVQDADGQMHEHGTPVYESVMDEASAIYAKHILETIGAHPRGASVWEWGCGEGRLLAAMMSMGCDVLAIEADIAMRDAARYRGVPATDEPPLDVRKQPDVAMAVHVLEHFRLPLYALKRMRRHLRPGGRVWLEVPNVERPYGSLNHFFQRPHLYNFSADTLAALLVRAGFDDINVTESNTVLTAYATHGTREACSYDEAIMRMGVAPPAGTEVAAKLAEYTRQRETSPGARLGAWLEAHGDADDWLRHEFNLMADALTVTLNSLGKMGEDLDEIITEDAWSPEPWVVAYRCGGKEMAQRAQVAVTHLANNLAARATR